MAFLKGRLLVGFDGSSVRFWVESSGHEPATPTPTPPHTHAHTHTLATMATHTCVALCSDLDYNELSGMLPVDFLQRHPSLEVLQVRQGWWGGRGWW